jgi:hypothetical protein
VLPAAVVNKRKMDSRSCNRSALCPGIMGANFGTGGTGGVVSSGEGDLELGEVKSICRSCGALG